jgi:serine/threonine protein phosphatase PrpC
LSRTPAVQPTAKLRFPPASGAIVGGREEQQDAARIEMFVTDTGTAALLLIVADGMGGHAGGREASSVAVDAFARCFHASSAAQFRPRMREALDAANQAVAARARASRELRGMGCTIVAAVLAGNYLRWISVGDSLLLAIKNREVVRLNADHSLAPELDRAVREGRLTQDEADADPDRNVLRSALTGGRMALIDEGARRLGEKALVLLATDGILTLPGERLARIGSQGLSAARTVQSLLSDIEADMAADQDNATLIAAYCEGGEAVGRLRRRRRRALGLGVLLAAGAGVSFSTYLLLAENWQDAEIRSRQPAIVAPKLIPPPAPSRATGEFDGRSLKRMPPGKNEGRGRRQLRRDGARNRVEPPVPAPALGGAAKNAREARRPVQPSSTSRSERPGPPAEPARPVRVAEPNHNCEAGIVLSEPNGPPCETRSSDRESRPTQRGARPPEHPKGTQAASHDIP